ncbi:MAG: hypothetical protein VXY54_12685, partial [Pseudomonadota bacterium]|nr:hypothetical protein [Pseudomonadota bacterium]
GQGRAPFGGDLELFKLGKGDRHFLAHLFARDLGLLIVASSSSLGIDFSFHGAQTDGSRHVSPYQKMLKLWLLVLLLHLLFFVTLTYNIRDVL